MARAMLRKMVFGLAATGLLMGCVAGGGTTSGSGSTGSVAAPGKKAGAQDVEAPEVFQTTDSALWDGRPSLGGIWVAAPEVTNPERALMFNPATGKSVTGALFRRERENPGPRLQLSSDAAEALGILAGQPTEIKVTALRKQEVAEPAEDEATAADPAGAASSDAATADADPAAENGDAAAIASAALAAVDAEKAPSDASAPGDPAAQDGDTSTAAAAGTAAVAAAALDGTATAVDEKPKRKTWKERRAEAKAAREAKKKAAAEAKAAAAAGTGAVAEGEVPTASPDAAAAAIAPIESAPLDARAPEAISSTEAGKPRKTVGDAPAAPETAVAPAPEVPAAPGPARPIQVASFSKEENAKRAADALAKIGVTATPQKSETNGKAVWGVVVMGDDAMLKKIKDAGFADAYYLK